MHTYKLVILEYHRIVSSPDNYKWSRTVEQFKEDIKKPFDYCIFDDCYKNQIVALDILRKENIRAKLAIVSSWIDNKHGQYNEFECLSKKDLLYYSRYHDIINHTHSHVNLTKISEAQIISEIQQCSDFIKSITGTYPAYLVPPFNKSNDTVQKLAASFNMQVILNRISISKDTVL